MFSQEELEIVNCIKRLLNDDNMDEFEALETYIEICY